MKPRGLVLMLLGLVGLFVLGSATYVVPEWEQVVVTEFGKPVGEPVTSAGLHFKKPFVQDVNRFDKRLLEWDGERNEIPTADKRFIWVDTTARWRIVDPLLFLQAVRNVSGAQARLDDVLDAATRDQVSAHELKEVVRVSNRILETAGEGAGSDDVEPIEVGRENIAEKILIAAAPKALEKYGIEIVDVRIKRINYTQSVREKVYERMRSERERIAEEYRSEGQGLKARITGELEREQKVIESEAYRQAQEIVAQADAEAARLFSDAYRKDEEFYAFWRSLETYEKVIGANHTLVISPDSQLYRFLFE